jgi:hypothetical protein
MISPRSMTRYWSASALGEVVVLLDQQDGHVALLGQGADGALDVLDDRGLDALGRLVEDQQARPKASARPMASCCCWPPERSPPRRRSICFSTGNISKMRGDGACRGPGGEAHLQVLLTVRRGKISRPCGT